MRGRFRAPFSCGCFGERLVMSGFKEACVCVTACRDRVILVLGLVLFVCVSPLDAQQTPSLFGGAQPEEQAPPLPPDGSPTLLRAVELRFPTQDPCKSGTPDPTSGLRIAACWLIFSTCVFKKTCFVN